MPQTNITHLPFQGSDHCPLLLEMSDNKDSVIKYFKFLNSWTQKKSFLQNVENCWKKKVVGNPMLILHTKMRRLTATLRNRSKKEYGDVFMKVKKYEELVREAEDIILHYNTKENGEKLQEVNAQCIRFLKIENVILQQKTQNHWLKEGDSNTKYFHAIMRGRRRRMLIHKIENDNGEWIQGEENIARETCDYYKKMFTGKTEKIREDIL